MNEMFHPPAIVRPAEDLAVLANKANAEHEAGETAVRKGLEHYRAAGDALLKAKAQCGHGKWLAWLKANVRFSQQTASNYMRLAEAGDKLPTVGNLREALQVLTPSHVVEFHVSDNPRVDVSLDLNREVTTFTGDGFTLTFPNGQRAKFDGRFPTREECTEMSLFAVGFYMALKQDIRRHLAEVEGLQL